MLGEIKYCSAMRLKRIKLHTNILISTYPLPSLPFLIQTIFSSCLMCFIDMCVANSLWV